MSARIPVSDLFAIVDAEDRDLVSAKVWNLSVDGYANTNIRRGRMWTTVSMHRLILAAKPGQITDHVNGVRLDNRRCNLRFATRAQNARNRRGVKGITWIPQHKRWQAQIVCDGKYRYLGLFAHRDEAIEVRRRAERELFAEFAPSLCRQ